MGSLNCEVCGARVWVIANGTHWVQCGHDLPRVARTPSEETLAAYEKWAYGEGWTDGVAEGRRRGFEDGYQAGFESGVEVGAARLLLALESLLEGKLPDLLPQLPDTSEFLSYRRRTAPTDEPCDAACGRCSRCIRAAAVAYNLRASGTRDFPGVAGAERRPA